MGLLTRRIGQLGPGIAGVNDAGLWIALSLLLTRSGELDDWPCRICSSDSASCRSIVGDGNGRAADDEKDDGSAIARAEIIRGRVGGRMRPCPLGRPWSQRHWGYIFILGAFVAGAVMPMPCASRYSTGYSSSP